MHISIQHSLGVGDWFIAKWRKRAAETSVRHVAERFKKDGVPLDIALLVLTRR